MDTFVHLLIRSLAVFVTGYLLSAGITIPSFWVAVVVAVVIGILNVFVKPFILILTLPINILTLGLFTFVINAFFIELTAFLVPGFSVANFWWAIAFSVVLSIVNIFLFTFL